VHFKSFFLLFKKVSSDLYISQLFPQKKLKSAEKEQGEKEKGKARRKRGTKRKREA